MTHGIASHWSSRGGKDHLTIFHDAHRLGDRFNCPLSMGIVVSHREAVPTFAQHDETAHLRDHRIRLINMLGLGDRLGSCPTSQI